MQAIGLIETYGLIAAIESADVMLKSAQVELLERSFTGGGLVTILVTGDVGAVRSAVDAAAAAVKQLSESALVSQHVIARPHEEMAVLVSGNVQDSTSDTEKAGLAEMTKEAETLTSTVADEKERLRGSKKQLEKYYQQDTASK